MTGSQEAWLRWTPRLLALGWASFISLFALDVFGEGFGPWRTLIALAVHLVPTGVLLATLAVAWRWPRTGGLLFILAGVAYSFRANNHLSWIVLIGGPAFVIGALFLLGGAIGRPRPD